MTTLMTSLKKSGGSEEEGFGANGEDEVFTANALTVDTMT